MTTITPLHELIVALEQQTWRALMISGRDLLPYLSSDCCMSFAGGKIFDHKSEPALVEILMRDGTLEMT